MSGTTFPKFLDLLARCNEPRTLSVSDGKNEYSTSTEIGSEAIRLFIENIGRKAPPPSDFRWQPGSSTKSELLKVPKAVLDAKVFDANKKPLLGAVIEIF